MTIQIPKHKFMQVKKLDKPSGKRAAHPVNKLPAQGESTFQFLRSLNNPKNKFNFYISCILQVFDIGTLSMRDLEDSIREIFELAELLELERRKLAAFLITEHEIRSAKAIYNTSLKRLCVLSQEDLLRLIAKHWKPKKNKADAANVGFIEK